ncbi:MAG: 16S rRNA (cytidine(1402)-2'-O)-methyltransferase [Fusobacteriaceae bacterium]|jgi:16S rRNA (cytidine1402-2'-O)-methyltransferase|nr:16S rRNA (cytidine(1402)-2'-O)-methyltransferase [Fusobacteriaceae bacterium]
MLYVVATPIGNLEDMTFRGVRTLRESEIIYAEDTRVTKKLLTHYDIATPLARYDEFSKARQIPVILARLREGKQVSLVTDAGTPCISDPGYELVDAALKEGIKVVPVPGPSALTAAASAAGISLRRFAFEGFLPKKKGRQTLFKALAAESRPVVLYESPYRVERTLGDILQWLGDRNVVLAREITKIYEEFFRGSVSEALAHVAAHPPKGEFVILIGEEAPCP